jgi:uncharacterized membrane protein YhaH (DUF805 family)
MRTARAAAWAVWAEWICKLRLPGLLVSWTAGQKLESPEKAPLTRGFLFLKRDAEHWIGDARKTTLARQMDRVLSGTYSKIKTNSRREFMAANPYTAPQSRVADIVEDAEYSTIKMWSAKGRIGRLRYLAYAAGASIMAGLVGSVAMATLGASAGAVVFALAYVALAVFSILIAIQRSHDMNWSGWMLFLAIIPFVALIWVFKSGSAGANDYGNPPPPNTTGVKILGLLFPIIAVIGILAAIALPAYQDYLERAQMQMQQQ